FSTCVLRALVYVFFSLLSSVFLFLSCPPCFSVFPSTTLFRSRLDVGVSIIFYLGAQTIHGHGESVIINKIAPAVPQTLQQDHTRSEEHTSELQSRFDLVCRLLLEKKKKTPY